MNDFKQKYETLNTVIRFCEREMQNLSDNDYSVGYKRALNRIITFCETSKSDTLEQVDKLSPSEDAKVLAVAQYLSRDDYWWDYLDDDERTSYLDYAREILDVANMAVMK